MGTLFPYPPLYQNTPVRWKNLGVCVGGVVWLGVEVGALCSLQGDQGSGREEKAVPDLQIQALGEAPLHLERPGIEAHFPAWWAVLALKGPAWAAPSTMNFLKSF